MSTTKPEVVKCIIPKEWEKVMVYFPYLEKNFIYKFLIVAFSFSTTLGMIFLIDLFYH